MALTAESAMAQARAMTGLSDFGTDEFRDGLDRLLEAIPCMPLLPQICQAIEDKVVRDLATRLRIEAWIAAHPEVEAEGIESVVLVCGLPRTGTTATVAMLALDDRFRFLRAWEASSPVPPPALAEEATDSRRLAAMEANKAYAMRSKHLNDPDGPEEDIALLAGLTMHSYNGHLPMPADYLEWWISKDFAGHYRYIERVLKLLQSRRGPRTWLLKSPPHMFKLRAFAERFPHTRYVWTHRDPAKVIPSAASLQTGMQAERALPGSVDPAKVGRTLLDFWRQGMDRGLAARAEIGEDRFIDIQNADVIDRPVETFERIYAHLNMPLKDDLRQQLLEYNARNGPGAFGAHRYSAEDYGLSAGGVREAFDQYRQRFGQ